jgi:hypothetical protein
MKEKKRVFREPNDHIGFWTMWYTLFTAILVTGTAIGVIVALIQLHNISVTSKADFILKFKDSFFKKEARELLDFLDEDSLKFVQIDSMPFFKVTKLGKDTIISAYEIDENLLNHFDDLGLFERKGIIKLDMVYSMFDWYIEDCWDNKEISKYIMYSRRGGDKDAFQNFEYIYNECKRYKENKEK